MQEELSGTEALGSLLPTHTSKTLNAIKAPRAVKRITFDRSEARQGETLYVHVPKLNENEALVTGSLGSPVRHRPYRRPRQQLSRTERVASACQQDGRKIPWHNLAGHGRLRPVQNIRGPVPFSRAARRHGT